MASIEWLTVETSPHKNRKNTRLMVGQWMEIPRAFCARAGRMQTAHTDAANPSTSALSCHVRKGSKRDRGKGLIRKGAANSIGIMLVEKF